MHQSTYISKILKRFYMDKAHPLSTPMVVRSLETIKDPFRSKGNDEELLYGTPFPARPVLVDPNRVRDALLSLNHSKSNLCGSDFKIWANP